MKIVALTSNAYVHVLPAFAYLFNKFYPEQDVTVAHYDVKPPKLPANFRSYEIGYQNVLTWSAGLKHYLESVDDEFVLLMLEDYYLDKPVDVKLIEATVNLMHEFKEVAKFDLTDDRLKVKYIDYKNGVIQSDINSPFLASTQAAIWRTDFLYAILNETDNPWQFEKTSRAKEYLQKHNSIILGCVNPPMSYVNAIGGVGTKPNEYDFKKFPQWMINELREKDLI